ncbi:MAG: 50S ribosomal protein L19 [Deltaproteobacteria bacterium]|nr:50S ribosomal protein L19 [Deltaproteobacteria bacterium]
MGKQHPKIEALHSQRIAETRSTPFRVGDTVRVHYKVVEGDKERIQVFQGQLIRLHRGGIGSTFTVRKVSYSVGVERIFPLYSPRIDKVEVIAHGRVRRARLYFLRGLEGKAARLKDTRDKAPTANANASTEAAKAAAAVSA